MEIQRKITEEAVARVLQNKMKVVCAWCGLVMGYKAGPEHAITHGICKDCREEIDNRLREDDWNYGQFIDYVNDTVARDE